MRRVALAVTLMLAVSAAAAPVEARTAATHGKGAATYGKRAAKKKKCTKRHRCATVRRARLARRAAAESLTDARPLMYGGPAPKRDRPPEEPGTPALPSFVSVAAKEFSLTLSRPLVGAGSVRIELRNSGEDPHNLVVSPEGTHTPLASFSELDPGAYERRSVTLSPGRYQLWCSLEFHEGYGMSVSLRVQ
jgi:hypothetical protein